jgi:hypothetical protein
MIKEKENNKIFDNEYDVDEGVETIFDDSILFFVMLLLEKLK